MNTLAVSLGAVSPIFIPMALGYVLRRVNILPEGFSGAVNDLIYKVCLGVLLFNTLYKGQSAGTLSPLLPLYVIVTLTAASLLLVPAVRKLGITGRETGAVVQGIFRGNASIYGIPIAMAMYGDSGLVDMNIVIVVSVVMFNALSVVVLSLCGGRKPDLREILRSIAKNPPIIFMAAGFAVKLLRVALPAAAENAIQQLSDMAVPLSFLAIGSTFSFSSARKHRKLISLIAAGKLVLMPLLFIPPAVLIFHCTDRLLVGLIGVYASPIPFAAYPMASAMGSDGELTAEALIVTSALSVLTIFAWICAFERLGLL